MIIALMAIAPIAALGSFAAREPIMGIIFSVVSIVLWGALLTA